VLHNITVSAEVSHITYVVSNSAAQCFIQFP